MSKPKLKTYGYDQTIHNCSEVNVETDKNGKVVSVWFRCMPIRFDQTEVDHDRAQSMKKMYKENELPKLHAIVVEDKNE